jgi:glycosyltransferase involved in cell wall biosynthesis
MRLLLTTDGVGGVWTYSLELARALRPLGVETTVAVAGPAPSRAQLEEASAFRLVQTGLPLEWVETSPDAVRRAGQEIVALASREAADIVQVSSAALLAGYNSSIPAIAVQHSCVASWWEAVKEGPLPDELQWRRDLVEAGLRRASAVVAPSAAFAAETTRLYGVPTTAVYNGRDTDGRSDIPPGEFVITAGRLWDEGKNVAVFDAAARMMETPFLAAGPVSGPNGASVQLENLQLLGKLEPARLQGLFAASPIYASAALYEPFGLSVIEAAQAGCALVLSDIPTHREIWGDAAVFVPARHPAGFAAAIEELMDSPAERERLGELARRRSAIFTPERMARGMADIYALVGSPAKLAGAA